jgi:hypothetical protein
LVQFCIHIANALYLASFLARDMLWLRVLTCAGLGLGVVFFSCQPSPLYGPAAWHVLFLAINGLQIWRLVLERRQLTLTREQERVGEATFQDLSRDELLTLLTRAVYEGPRKLQDIHQACQQELTKEERALRDIAFSRLSRGELLNLLTRRLWHSLRRQLVPSRRGWPRRDIPGAAPAGRGVEAARAPAGSDSRC